MRQVDSLSWKLESRSPRWRPCPFLTSHLSPLTSSPSGCANAGFTLLEVLVVVAIIALLIAALIPSVGAAQRHAKDLACQTNLRAIAGAWQQYLTESGGRFLKSQRARDKTEINFGGRQGDRHQDYGARPDRPVDKPLNRYLGLPPVVRTGADLFRCPRDSGSDAIRPSCFDSFGSSYLMNHLLVGPPNQQALPGACCEIWQSVVARIDSLNVSQLADPARLLLVGDYGWYNAWSDVYTPEDHLDWHGRPMHHNLAFMDGHVRLTRIRKGIHATDHYTIIPFHKEQADMAACQVEVP